MAFFWLHKEQTAVAFFISPKGTRVQFCRMLSAGEAFEVTGDLI